MKTRTQIIILVVLIVAGSSAVAVYVLKNQKGSYEQLPPTREFDHSYTSLGHVLQNHVKDSKVDYAAIKSSPIHLNTFLDEAAALQRSIYDTWSDEQKLAFLINLYNAATIKLVIENYPVGNMKDIGNSLVTAWNKPVVRLFGDLVSLDHVEHKMIRKDFDEPRIHFAIVCAAVSCPPLRTEAYVPDRLSDQMDEQGIQFLANTDKNRLDTASKTAYLSKIFDWFGEDFTSDKKALLKSLSPWFSKSDQQKIAEGEWRVEFNKYDWSLNDK